MVPSSGPFPWCRCVTGEADWEAIRQRRVEDLLVYLALSHFRKSPTLAQLPRVLQADMRAFFATYAKGCRQADELLFQAGNAQAIDDACKRSKVGKLLPEDLYVHRSGLDSLEPLLRIYEGCGRAFLGEVEGANIIKIHRRSGKLSYLVYPDFENDPHPALLRSIRVNLRTRQIESDDYSQSANPPVLHRKETSCRGMTRSGRNSPASQPRKKSTACWTTQALLGRARDGLVGWPHGDSLLRATAWSGA